MAKLVTMEAGMGVDTSIPALNDNFKNLNAELATGGPVATQKVTIDNGGTKGYINFSRQGSLVTGNGNFDAMKLGNANFIEAADIPVGYRNTRNTPFGCVVASTSHAESGSQIRNGANGGINLTSFNGVTVDSGQFSFSYPTDDDFPD